MSDITIAYYGHSCFRISYQGDTIVFDPYEDDSVPGYVLPKNIASHHVICSHQHADHNAAHLIERISGNDAFGITSFTVPHDDAGGAKRGMCEVTMVKAGKAKIVHMGDIGRLPSREEYEKLKGTDVLLIPVGGYFTIDAGQAAKIISEVSAPLTILMHYRRGKRGYDVTADINEIAGSFPGLQQLKETSLTFDEENVPHGIVTLDAIQ